jgi:hypothetical protein
MGPVIAYGLVAGAVVVAGLLVWLIVLLARSRREE